MLEIKNIVKTYKSKSGVTVKALDNVSLKFPKKGMVFILGKSGSGKSTMLNVLGGLDGFDSGEILVNGESTLNFKQSHFDSFRNTYVGFIFQEYNILDNFTVGQNIALAMQLQSRKPTSETINKILDEVELNGLGDRKPNELSGGQKQRVAIARALVKNPQIIMADEPTGALDSNTGIQIFDTLKRLSNDKLVIIISHDREFSERYADRIIELKDGKVISDVTNISNNQKQEVNNLVYASNEIYVKKDYILTQKDLKEINAFLKECKNGAKIKSGSGKFTVNSRGKFTNTNEKDIKIEKTGFTLIKSHLPLSRAFKMGVGGLGHKKFKLVMTIILSLIAFTMLGASATVGLTDQNKAVSNALSSSNYTQLNVEKNKYQITNFAGSKQLMMTGDSYPLESSDISNIKNIVGDNAIELNRLRYNSSTDYISYNNVQIDELNSYGSQASFMNSFTRFAKIDNPTKTLNNAGYALYDYEESYGDTTKPVLISKYLFDSIRVKNGITLSKYGGGSETITLNSSTDKIIGCQLGLFSSSLKVTVVGVFDTGFNIFENKYSTFLDKTYYYGTEPEYLEITTAKERDINSCCIGVYSGFLDDISSAGSSYQSLILEKTGLTKSHDFSNTANTSKLVNSLYKEFNNSNNYVYKYSIGNQMTYQLVSMFGSFISPIKTIFLYIGLAFIVFSGLLLANFIANSISYQRREIGILRAIGARGNDVFKIYGSEAFIIALVNFVLSCISTFVVIKFVIGPQLNKLVYGISILKFGIIEILILFGVTFLSALLASFIPVRKTARKKPVEAIRNK